MGDPTSYESARTALVTTVAALANVAARAVAITSVTVTETLVDAGIWLAGPDAGMPPIPAFPDRTPGAATVRVRQADISMTVSSYPARSCIADAAGDFVRMRLNTSAALGRVASNVALRAAPNGYSVPRNVRVSLAPASLSAAPLAACPGASLSLPISAAAGFDVRALPASYPNNNYTTGIVVVDAAACSLAAGSALSCKDTGRAFSVDGRSFFFAGTLADLNMVAV
jgi:hypothetical protein